MRKFERLPAPQLFTDYGEEIGKKYEAKRMTEPNYRFAWPQINNQKLNHVALTVLIEQTKDHCSYCDKYPPHKGDYSIDHFKPKTYPLYHVLVCQWENLYLACKHCQDSKMSDYDELLLRPDDVDFSFSRYFTYNYKDHSIEPNPSAQEYDQQRADITIKMFDLNFYQVKTSRRHAFERYCKDPIPEINDYNYRFMFDI